MVFLLSRFPAQKVVSLWASVIPGVMAMKVKFTLLPTNAQIVEREADMY
jgi:hypothetical protein